LANNETPDGEGYETVQRIVNASASDFTCTVPGGGPVGAEPVLGKTIAREVIGCFHFSSTGNEEIGVSSSDTIL
jgi:hypothetical protein